MTTHKIKNEELHFPFVESITHISVGEESAETIGFPESGSWRRVDDDTWELTQSFVAKEQPFDESKCSECQNWGYPTGCKTCGLTCMGG